METWGRKAGSLKNKWNKGRCYIIFGIFNDSSVAKIVYIFATFFVLVCILYSNVFIVVSSMDWCKIKLFFFRRLTIPVSLLKQESFSA